MKICALKITAATLIVLGAGFVGFTYYDLGRARELVRTTPGTSPFIVRDTETDSPGTNIVTRIVTFTAQVDGAPPLTRQWKVDHGQGFAAIPGATNATFRIGNAQVSDSGLYALFATNSFGATNTTPVPLIVIEGVD